MAQDDLYADDGLLSRWLALTPADWQAAWQGPEGEALRRALAARPWQDAAQGLARPQRRLLLEAAIARLHADSSDAAAHLVLRAYGRDYELPAPAWLQTWLASSERLLRLLPPLESLTPTVLIPSYNRLAKLERAVASVRGQSFTGWRLLIADDGSSDGTESYCRQLAAGDERISYLRKPRNTGLADSYDLLCREAGSELVLGLADDDYLMPGCLESLLSLYRRYPWIALAGGGYYQLHLKQGQLMAKQYGPYYPQPGIADPRLELQRCGIVNPLFGSGQLLRRSVLARVAAADPELGAHRYSTRDWLNAAQVLAHFEVGYSPEIVTAYLDEADSPNTFAQDQGPGQMRLLELLLSDYAALFGPGTYPEPIARYFLELVAEPALVQAFHRVLNRHSEAAEMDDFLSSQRALWESHRRLRSEVLPGLSQACLIDEHSTSGLTRGEIPGLAQGTAPAALQQLIRALLQRLHRP